MADYEILGLADENKNSQGQYQILGPDDESSAEQKLNNNISYLNNLSSSEGFLSKLPKNIAIGLIHAGRNIHNLPHNIVQSVEGITTIPNIKRGKSLSEYLPNDVQDYSDILGMNPNNKTLGDKLVQVAVEHVPDIIGIGSGISGLLREFPITQRGAARQLREAEKLIGERGISTPVPNQMINESIPFIPNSYATRELLGNAAAGDYSSAFGLQSQIGKHERDLTKSTLAAERLLAPQARELKQRIVGELESQLRDLGHHDIADRLKGGINDYRKYIKFRDDVKPILKWAGIPTTGLALLGIGLTKGKNIASQIIE